MLKQPTPWYLSLFDTWRKPSGWRLAASLLLLLLLLTGTGWLVYVSGGTKYVSPHLMYLPVVLAALWFNLPGALLTALAAGLILGPFTPLNVATGEPQLLANWLQRTLFYALVGGVVGKMSYVMNHRLDRLQGTIDHLSQTYAQTLKTFASLVSLRDEQTGGHCERVAHNATTVGDALGLSKQELEQLHWAGILHDLGKISTPAYILLKPGKLTPEEYAEMKQHAALGSDVLLSVSKDFAPIAAGVRAHHERWDGKGYPDGLAGKKIPLFGRILAIVDVFEALTSQRPYRKPLAPEEAMAYIRQHAGTHFDPSLARIFEEVYRQGRMLVSGDELKRNDYKITLRVNDHDAKAQSASPERA